MKYRILLENLSVFASKMRYFLIFCFACFGISIFFLFRDKLSFFKLSLSSSSIFIAALLFMYSALGRRLMNFAKDSYIELKRVSWPTRKETVQMTGIVFVFVFLMSIFMGLLDKVIEFFLYRLFLGWK